MKSIIVIFISLLLVQVGSAQEKAKPSGPANLDELLQKVVRDRLAGRKELTARERRFVAARNRQKSMLDKEMKTLRSLEAVSKRLQAQFEKQEKELAVLEEQLTIASGALGEMFGVVKQVAGDFKGQFQNSVVSAQFPGRDEFMGAIAERKKLPALADLNRLWFEIQREMTESGKVVRFKGKVVTPDGSKTERPVVRVGSFNLVSDEKYLSYQSSTNQILELPRQPQGKFLGLIEGLEEAKSGHNAFGLDPSRGAILGMLIQAPSLVERIKQGGLVGYVILTLLLLGLVLVGERLIFLQKEGKKMDKQLARSAPLPGNPLGSLMESFEKHKGADMETLEMKLDETIIKAAPGLERGIPTIKILSAVAPLLGLLGTVTGMIATFQSITLFGTGDPKLMAGGISTALITTVLGLVCAIPLLLLHNVVSSKSKHLLHILEEQAAGMLAKKAEADGTAS